MNYLRILSDDSIFDVSKYSTPESCLVFIHIVRQMKYKLLILFMFTRRFIISNHEVNIRDDMLTDDFYFRSYYKNDHLCNCCKNTQVGFIISKKLICSTIIKTNHNFENYQVKSSIITPYENKQFVTSTKYTITMYEVYVKKMIIIK